MKRLIAILMLIAGLSSPANAQYYNEHDRSYLIYDIHQNSRGFVIHTDDGTLFLGRQGDVLFRPTNTRYITYAGYWFVNYYNEAEIVVHTNVSEITYHVPVSKFYEEQ